MKIKTAEFVHCFPEPNDGVGDGLPQVAFIGRSNVGKSSIINSLTGQLKLARSSATPGITRVINLYLVNKNLYLIDLPGYGFAKDSFEVRERLHKLIWWYLFESSYTQKKVIFIIDAVVGPTKNDMEMLQALEGHGKNVVIIANKVDKIKKKQYLTQIKQVKAALGDRKMIEYSSVDKTGFDELMNEVFE